MSWITLALLANIFFGLANIFDKFFNSKKIKSVYTFAILVNLIYLGFVVVITFILRDTFTAGLPAVYSSIAGLLWFFMWIFFWKAMQTGEASRVSAIFFSQPLFSAVIAVLFLGETLNSQKWLGILFIVIGAFLSSWEGKGNKNGFKKAYVFAIIAALLSALGNAVSKYAMSDLPSLTVNSIAFYATIPLYLVLLRNEEVFKEVKENLLNKKVMFQFLIRGTIGYAGIIAFMLSLGQGKYSLVSAISGTQPLFVLILSVLFTVLMPKTIHEEISRKSLMEKSLAITLIVVGAMMISF